MTTSAARASALAAWSRTLGVPAAEVETPPGVLRLAWAITEADEENEAAPTVDEPWRRAKRRVSDLSLNAARRWPAQADAPGVTQALEILLWCAACCDRSTKRGAYIQRILRLPQDQQQELMGAMKAQMALEREAKSPRGAPLTPEAKAEKTAESARPGTTARALFSARKAIELSARRRVLCESPPSGKKKTSEEDDGVLATLKGGEEAALSAALAEVAAYRDEVEDLRAQLLCFEEAREAERARALAAEMKALESADDARGRSDDTASALHKEAALAEKERARAEARAAMAEARLREALDEVDVLRPSRERAEALERQVAKLKEKGLETAEWKQRVRRAEAEVAEATRRCCAFEERARGLEEARGEVASQRAREADLVAALKMAQADRDEARGDVAALAADAQRFANEAAAAQADLKANLEGGSGSSSADGKNDLSSSLMESAGSVAEVERLRHAVADLEERLARAAPDRVAALEREAGVATRLSQAFEKGLAKAKSELGKLRAANADAEARAEALEDEVQRVGALLDAEVQGRLEEREKMFRETADRSKRDAEEEACAGVNAARREAALWLSARAAEAWRGLVDRDVAAHKAVARDRADEVSKLQVQVARYKAEKTEVEVEVGALKKRHAAALDEVRDAGQRERDELKKRLEAQMADGARSAVLEREQALDEAGGRFRADLDRAVAEALQAQRAKLEAEHETQVGAVEASARAATRSAVAAALADFEVVAERRALLTAEEAALEARRAAQEQQVSALRDQQKRFSAEADALEAEHTRKRIDLQKALEQAKAEAVQQAADRSERKFAAVLADARLKAERAESELAEALLARDRAVEASETNLRASRARSAENAARDLEGLRQRHAEEVASVKDELETDFEDRLSTALAALRSDLDFQAKQASEAARAEADRRLREQQARSDSDRAAQDTALLLVHEAEKTRHAARLFKLEAKLDASRAAQAAGAARAALDLRAAAEAAGRTSAAEKLSMVKQLQAAVDEADRAFATRLAEVDADHAAAVDAERERRSAAEAELGDQRAACQETERQLRTALANVQNEAREVFEEKHREEERLRAALAAAEAEAQDNNARAAFLEETTEREEHLRAALAAAEGDAREARAALEETERELEEAALARTREIEAHRKERDAFEGEQAQQHAAEVETLRRELDRRLLEAERAAEALLLREKGAFKAEREASEAAAKMRVAASEAAVDNARSALEAARAAHAAELTAVRRESERSAALEADRLQKHLAATAAADVDSLTARHAAALESAQQVARLEAGVAFDSKVQRLAEAQAADVASLKRDHKAALENLATKLEQAKIDEVEALKKAHKAALEAAAEAKRIALATLEAERDRDSDAARREVILERQRVEEEALSRAVVAAEAQHARDREAWDRQVAELKDEADRERDEAEKKIKALETAAVEARRRLSEEEEEDARSAEACACALRSQVASLERALETTREDARREVEAVAERARKEADRASTLAAREGAFAAEKRGAESLERLRVELEGTHRRALAAVRAEAEFRSEDAVRRLRLEKEREHEQALDKALERERALHADELADLAEKKALEDEARRFREVSDAEDRGYRRCERDRKQLEAKIAYGTELLANVERRAADQQAQLAKLERERAFLQRTKNNSRSPNSSRYDDLFSPDGDAHKVAVALRQLERDYDVLAKKFNAQLAIDEKNKAAKTKGPATTTTPGGCSLEEEEDRELSAARARLAKLEAQLQERAMAAAQLAREVHDAKVDAHDAREALREVNLTETRLKAHVARLELGRATLQTTTAADERQPTSSPPPSKKNDDDDDDTTGVAGKIIRTPGREIVGSDDEESESTPRPPPPPPAEAAPTEAKSVAAQLEALRRERLAENNNQAKQPHHQHQQQRTTPKTPRTPFARLPVA